METIAIVAFLAISGVLIGVGVYQHTQSKKVRDELYKLVSQTGAQNISIEDELGGEDFFLFKLTYQDVNGKWQERHVSRQKGDFRQGKGEFMWDRPLVNEPDISLSSRLNSKEQIISDMDAEIKRLQQELEKARNED